MLRLLTSLGALLASVEARHWAALGVSAALHGLVWWSFPAGGPPAPKPLTFEIALQPPEPEPAKRPRVKSKNTADKTRARLAKTKPPKPRKTEPLQTAFVEEAKKPQAAPAVDLPRLETPSTQAQERPAHPAAPASVTALAPAQTAEADGGFSEPGAASLASAGSSASAATAVLAQSQTPGQSRSASTGGGAQASEAQGGVQAAASAGVQAGTGTFQASHGAGVGLNVAAGSGAQAVHRSDSQPLAGGEPKGSRLAVAGVAAQAASLPTGRGSLEAAPASPEAGRAAPSPASGKGQAFASAQAGGVSASPLAPGPRQAGQGGQASNAPAARAEAARGGGPGPARLASTRIPAQSLPGGAGQTTPQVGLFATPAGVAMALKPGEPGSSPRFAVAMAPLVSVLAPVQGGGRGGKGSGQAQDGPAASPALPGDEASSGAGLSRSAPAASSQFAGARASGGNQRSAGGLSVPSGQSLGGGQSPRTASASGRLQGIKVADNKVMRADSQMQKLDVLAPSSFCPLPLHPQPDNRPKARPTRLAGAIELPDFTTNARPVDYPPLATIQGISGALILRVQVLEDGSVGQTLLKKGSGNAFLDRDAQDQIARQHFTPARKNGQAVSFWVDIPVEYRLPDNR